MTQTTADSHRAREYALRLQNSLTQVVVGSERTVRHLLAAYLTRGHVLLEDFPGTGKTTLSKALAAAVGLSFNRIQCTPDLLPADILGVSIYSPKTESFTLHKGPIFADILLADEINRASPRTQSALLEAMAERQVTLDVTTHRLAPDFFVIATQNPVELQGTYPLPEAQLDRFALRLSLGYVSEQQEVDLARTRSKQLSDPRIDACLTRAELAAITAAADEITISDEVLTYAVRLVTTTRARPAIALGASPRATLTLIRCARALALFDGESFVTPEHVQELAQPVLAHRLTLASSARYQGLDPRHAIEEILAETPAPK